MNTSQSDSLSSSDIETARAGHAETLQGKFMQIVPTDLPFMGARIHENRIEIFYVAIKRIDMPPPDTQE